MAKERVLRVRIPEELYWLLLKEAGSPKRLSATVAELLEKALSLQVSEPPSLQVSKPSIHQAIESSGLEAAKPSSVEAVESSNLQGAEPQPQPTETERDRLATPAQVEAIWNIAWEISSWNDVKDVVSRLVGFPVPDDPSQLTVSQASKVIEVLGKLNRKLGPRQAKAVERLLKKVAEREGLKPEEVADKYNVPLETSQLKRYHLELLKMLAGETK
jgi:hypothetical protein